MTEADYRTAARYAGEWSRGLFLRRVQHDELKRIELAVGIYFACSAGGALHYVGSAVRPGKPQGVATRILSHPADRRRHWRWFWLLPLAEDTPRGAAEAVEGLIIDHLAPPGNRRRHRPRYVPGR